MAKTLYEKLFDAHVVYETPDETPLLYIDRHLVHEVTSPQAFDGLRAHKRPVRQPDKTFATMDHNVSTQTKDINASGEMARIQMQELIKNCNEFGVELYDLNHPYQGIVHVMGPETGYYPAGHDHCLRRLPHRDARRIWRPGVRDWHL